MKPWKLGAFALAIAGLSIGLASPAGASGGTFFPYSQPGTPASPSYTGTTCAIDFSSIPDYTTGITSVTGCGVTVTFSVPMEKRSVPASWGVAAWGSPADVENATPSLLYSSGATSVTLTYHTGSPAGAGRRTVGVEAEADFYGTETVNATFTGAVGGVEGTVSRSETVGSENGGALLFAARTKSPAAKIATLTISSDFADLAIAQIRV